MEPIRAAVVTGSTVVNTILCWPGEAALYDAIPCPPSVGIGWTYDAALGEFIAPPEAPFEETH